MFWKILTHDFRPPIQGGDPLCDGRTWPVKLPDVPLDRSSSECGVVGSWHFCRSIEAALKLGGMWPSGRPSAVVAVEPLGDIIERGDKCRAAWMRLLRTATDDEIADAIRRFSAMFAPHADRMAEEQIAWRAALSRPERNVAAVECGLRLALDARKLGWSVKQFSARDARDAWVTWNYAWNAKAVWDSAEPPGRQRRQGRLGRLERLVRQELRLERQGLAWNARAASLGLLGRQRRQRRQGRQGRNYGMLCIPPGMDRGSGRHAQRRTPRRLRGRAGLRLPIAPNTLGWAMAESPHA